MSIIDLIKNNIPITDALERYAGVNFHNAKTNRSKFNIICPYHDDRSPSFTIYTETNSFKCWAGCNEGRPGDVIDVVKLSLGKDIKGAIKTLISDYGLSKPSSRQAKDWESKRNNLRQSMKIKKGLKKKVSETIETLKRVEKVVKTATLKIETVEEMNKFGDLYHLLVQIDYWLDCLIEDNPVIQVQTLVEVNRFLEKTQKKVG